MRSVAAFLCLAFLAPRALAQDAPFDPERLEGLVRDLGAQDFGVRESSSAEIERIGRPAIPRRREALGDPDAEIGWRARRLLDRIDPPTPAEPATPDSRLLPGVARIPLQRVQVRVAVRAAMANRNVERTFEVEEDGKTWKFVQKADGSIEGSRPGEDGEPVAFSFEDAQAMEKADPELHARMSGKAGRVRVQVGEPSPPRTPELPRDDYLGIVAGSRAVSAAGAGFPVESVRPDTPAAAAGIAAEDVIVAANGRSVEDLAGLRRVGEALQAGEPLHLEALRDGRPIEIVIR